jgi:hypothetical protein
MMSTPVIKHLARYVRAASIASRRHIDLSRIGLGIGDELRNAPGSGTRLRTRSATLRMAGKGINPPCPIFCKLQGVAKDKYKAHMLRHARAKPAWWLEVVDA